MWVPRGASAKGEHVRTLPGRLRRTIVPRRCRRPTPQQGVPLAGGSVLCPRDGVRGRGGRNAPGDRPLDPDYNAPLVGGFTRQLRQHFGAEVASLDLTSGEAVSRINAWVSHATRGKIAKMLDEPL